MQLKIKSSPIHFVGNESGYAIMSNHFYSVVSAKTGNILDMALPYHNLTVYNIYILLGLGRATTNLKCTARCTGQ